MAMQAAVPKRDPFASLLTRFTSGELEALKWLALVAMVADHVDLLLFQRGVPWLHDLGRLAFPLFALVFGYNLARPRADGIKVAVRLLPAAALSSIIWAQTAAAPGLPWLNVLWAFAGLAVPVELAKNGHRLSAVVLLVASGFLVEAGWFGYAVALSGFWIGRRPERAGPWLAALVAVFLLQAVNGSAWAMLTVPVVLAVRWWRPQVPHLRGLFLWFYPVHLAALWLGAELLS